MLRATLAAACALAVNGEGVTLSTFDGAKGTTQKWEELNDPVMGGRSTGTFTIQNGAGVFNGSVVDVPSLKAPGFIKVQGRGDVPDASATIGGALVLTVRTTTPEYKGFRVSFASGSVNANFACAGGGTLPFSRGCFKAKFSVPSGSKFSEVRVPFSEFSDKWSPATGEHNEECSKDKDVCPTAKELSKIQDIEIWAEGALGNVHLEVQSIAAEPATEKSIAVDATPSTDLALVTFDGAKGTTYTWETLLDPVMGGRSNGSCDVKDGALVFNGYCAIVPSLKAPGFITAKLEGSALTRLADASDYDALKISLRSATPDYKGFKISFAASTLSPTIACATGKDVLGTGCFKSPFTAKADWSDVVIPFSSFTDEWSSATGKPTGQHAPSKGNLGDIQTFSFWGEGVEGKVNLEVRGIYATNTANLNVAAPTAVPLVTFDGKDGTTFKWSEGNDPVMGGQSVGTFKVNENGTGTFDGEVKIVPSLAAPGFTKVSTGKGLFSHPHFNDASSLIDGGLELHVRTETPEYKGHKLSFGPAYGQQIFNEFKAPFYPSNTRDWQKVYIPFSNFSSDWSSYTGACDTKDPNGKQHHCCDADHSDVCIKATKLAGIDQMSIWSEGVAGRYHLEIASITAVPSA